jgi:hypothetical protein
LLLVQVFGPAAELPHPRPELLALLGIQPALVAGLSQFFLNRRTRPEPLCEGEAGGRTSYP